MFFAVPYMDIAASHTGIMMRYITDGFSVLPVEFFAFLQSFYFAH